MGDEMPSDVPVSLEESNLKAYIDATRRATNGRNHDERFPGLAPIDLTLTRLMSKGPHDVVLKHNSGKIQTPVHGTVPRQCFPAVSLRRRNPLAQCMHDIHNKGAQAPTVYPRSSDLIEKFRAKKKKRKFRPNRARHNYGLPHNWRNPRGNPRPAFFRTPTAWS